MKKYNIVLVPSSGEVSRMLIRLAKEISVDNNLKPNYLLKYPDKESIPHVTIFQFEMDDAERLESIWKIALETWREVKQGDDSSEIVCNLLKMINYRNHTSPIFSGISWSEISISKTENPLLQKFHDTLRERLAHLKIVSLNASGEHYSPHFTLFDVSTVSLDQARVYAEIPKSYVSGLGLVSLVPALGEASDRWELTSKLYKRV